MATPILLSAQSGEPVSLEEAKSWLRMDGIDAEDALIQSSLKAAREWFEIACDRSFRVATWELRLPAFGGYIELPDPPTEVLAVEYLDADGNLQTLSPSVYDVVTSLTPVRIALANTGSWPTTAVHPEAVRVVYAGGGQPVPEMVKQGIKMLTAAWTTYRGDPLNAAAAELAIPPQVMHIAWACASYRY